MEWRNPSSVGYQFINALFGNQAEYANSLIGDSRENYHPSTANYNEPYLIWKTYHETSSGNIPPSAYVTATLDPLIYHSIPSGTVEITSTTIELINADDQEAFFHGIPTRLTYDPSNDIVVSDVLGNITGLTYVRDWSKVDASGITLIPKQNVYIVNQDLSTPVIAATKSTVVYDTDWNILDSYDYGLGYQDYANTGKYEIITDPSGYTLEYDPIVSSVTVYDYLNLDSNGNAQVIESDYYTLTQSTTDYVTSTSIAMSGVNPYNGYHIRNSNYFIAYQYKKYNYPMEMTTQSAWWHLQKESSPPVFTSYPVNYNGTVVRHEIAHTPSGNAFALRVDPRDLRPGASGDVKFNFVSASDVAWSHTAPFDDDLSSDQWFLNTASGGVHIYHKGNDITPTFDPHLSGDSQIYIDPVDSPPHPAPFTVRMYYNAQRTYSGITAVQSFATAYTEADPYPQDYMIENGYLIPYSILPLSDANDQLQLALLAARADQFEVVTDLLFTGIAYDRDKDCYWMLENNNLALYKIRPSDGTILDKWNIFKPPNFYISDYKSTASGVIDRLDNRELGYPFISHDRDVGDRTMDGCVYYKDFLYVVSDMVTGVVATHTDNDGNESSITIGGAGLYPLDTYNERVMDMEWNTTPAEVYPHFPYPTNISGVVDITMNDDEDFLVAESSRRWDMYCVGYYGVPVDNTVHDITTEDISFSAWIKANSSGQGTDYIFNKYGTLGGSNWLGYAAYILGPENNARFLIRTGATTYYVIRGSTDIRDDEWHHIAFVIDRDNVDNTQHYLDGVLDESTTRAGTIGDVGSLANAWTLTLGCISTGGSWYEGYVTDVKLYYAANGYWTDEQVAYQASHKYDYSAQAGPITEYWRVDEGTGTTLNGSAGNNLTLNDSAAWNQYESARIKKLTVCYDYTLIDSVDGVTRGTVYYRENYPSGITVESFPEWSD